MKRVIQYLAFAFIGGIGSAIALGLTHAFTEFAGVWYLLSYIISTLLAWTFNFYMHSKVTFHGHSKEGYMHQYIKFVMMYVVAFAVNVSCVFLLTSGFGVHYLISIIVVTTVISFFTFWWSKQKIFLRGSLFNFRSLISRKGTPPEHI